jgi:c-di-GMP-binding flagellar brake protein YcgR
MNLAESEKRRYPRTAVGLTLDIQANCQEAGKIRGTISDMSVSGMSLKTNAELEEGMTLHLKFTAPQRIEIRGEVRNVQDAEGGYRYGVRFHKIQK